MQYRKQGKDPSCGPYALYNLMVWAGHKKTLKDIKKIIGYNGLGTYSPQLQYGIQQINNINFKWLYIHPKLKEIDQALDDGNAIIYRYFKDSKHCGHYALCVGRTPKTYIVINDHKEKIVSNKYRRTMYKNLRLRKETGGITAYPCAWVVEKV